MSIQKTMKELMKKKMYPIEMEVESKFGMFRRPDTGSDGTSYPAPTFSAAKGMMERPIKTFGTRATLPVELPSLLIA